MIKSTKKISMRERFTVSRGKGALLASSALAVLAVTATPVVAVAQDEGDDEIVVTGIRSSLESALAEKRSAESLIEVIKAEDIGKLPDQNLAEVLENITGIQITRTAGVGTNVQIRGTDDNRTEINGVSTLGSGGGRSGINFQDVNSSIIAAVEVIKVPEASTIEGSVGGTINLRTIRPLDLSETLISLRVQGEQNNLSDAGIQPRFAGSFGDNWETGLGEFGFVISGSYTQQEAVSFRPRVDRDNVAEIPTNDPPEFLGIQFLVQERENFDFETINIASTVEWEPTEELNLYFDALVNQQDQSQDSFRLQASGISSFIDDVVPTAFETVDFGVGTDLGNGPGVFPAALTGVIARNGVDDDNGNLRFSSDTGSRVTNSTVFSAGGTWQRDNLTAHFEYARSRSNSTFPNLSTTLNFLNPNSNLVADVEFIDPVTGERDDINVGLVGDIQTLEDAVASVPGGILFNPDGTRASQIFNDNSTPFAFDLTDGALAFGIATSDPEAPTSEQLLDPNNVVLDQVQVSDNETRNTEDAVRFDVAYDLGDSSFGGFLSSVEVGYRYNNSSSSFSEIEDNIGGFSVLEDSPNGSLFAELLVPGPDNFDAADGRELFIADFLLIDPDLAFSDRDGTLAILEGALAEQRSLEPAANGELTSEPVLDEDAFFDVTENTHAAYLQANFETGPVRGNVGIRYVNTSVNSVGFGPEDSTGARSLQSTFGGYDFFLPRFNLAASLTDNFVLRLGYASDILRPNFSALNSGFTLNQSENASVSVGNPNLVPEQVDSIDISAEWYFAPAAVFSVGYFLKDRTNLFVQTFEGAALFASDDTPSGNARETDPTCPGGGIFNPEVIPNVLGDPNIPGLCVDLQTPGNDPAVTTQQGVEVAFQYSLADWEDTIGWASGFGVIANYTYQQFSGGSDIDTTSGRGLDVLGDVSIPEGLLDFSNNAYNITGFYEKYGLTIRARWTWREAFRTNDFGGGANTSGSSTFSFPVVTESRGQLNASISYDITENFNIGAEVVNLTKSNIVQRCVSETGPICFVGFPDRRITFGGSYRF